MHVGLFTSQFPIAAMFLYLISSYNVIHVCFQNIKFLLYLHVERKTEINKHALGVEGEGQSFFIFKCIIINYNSPVSYQ